MFSLNFMFFCSLIEELCTKEEKYKTSCNFNFGHECTPCPNKNYFIKKDILCIRHNLWHIFLHDQVNVVFKLFKCLFVKIYIVFFRGVLPVKAMLVTNCLKMQFSCKKSYRSIKKQLFQPNPQHIRNVLYDLCMKQQYLVTRSLVYQS